MLPKPVFEIDGASFSTLEEFAGVFSQVLLPQWTWNGNLNAFHDILRGGLGTPDGGFVLRWTNSNVSRQRLGYPETVRQLTLRLERCHPSNNAWVADDLRRAQEGRGPTAFDWLVEIIKEHGPGGEEAEDGVELVLA